MASCYMLQVPSECKGNHGCSKIMNGNRSRYVCGDADSRGSYIDYSTITDSAASKTHVDNKYSSIL